VFRILRSLFRRLSRPVLELKYYARPVPCYSVKGFDPASVATRDRKDGDVAYVLRKIDNEGDPYWWCLWHKSAGCECASAVKRAPYPGDKPTYEPPPSKGWESDTDA
jgi:hypothetical protein